MPNADFPKGDFLFNPTAWEFIRLEIKKAIMDANYPENSIDIGTNEGLEQYKKVPKERVEEMAKHRHALSFIANEQGAEAYCKTHKLKWLTDEQLDKAKEKGATFLVDPEVDIMIKRANADIDKPAEPEEFIN